MSIELKSTATLIDELLTAEIKLKHFGSDTVQERYNMLDIAIKSRLSRHNDKDKFHTLSVLILKLKRVNQDCWDAQERVMLREDTIEDTIEIATAAKQAQKLNAQRNNIIREIDDLLGESQYSQLEKSYG